VSFPHIFNLYAQWKYEFSCNVRQLHAWGRPLLIHWTEVRICQTESLDGR